MYKKEHDKDSSVKLIQVVSKYSEKWRKISSSDMEKYEEIYNQEKEKFKKDLEIVKRYLIANYVKEGATAYRLFLETKLREGFDNDDSDIKQIKKRASDEWKEMSHEERRQWNNKKKENDDWWEKAKTSRSVNSYAVFCQKKIAEAREKDKTLVLTDCSKLWSKISDKDKLKYKKYADEMNEERRQKREVYEICTGIKPKRPVGAFRLFLMEKAKEGRFSGKNAIKEGRKMWEDLKEDDKENYLKLSHRIRLSYIYKKMLYKKKVKDARPSKPKTAYNLFISELKGKKVPKDMTFLEFAQEKWKKTSEDGKKVYYDKAEKERQAFDKKMEKIQNRVFDQPKLGRSAYQIFISQSVVQLKEEKPKKAVTDLLTESAGLWNDLSDKEKKKYEKESLEEKEQCKAQRREFKSKGYYTSNTKEEKTKEKKQKEKESRSQSKKKSQKSSQSTKKDKK